MVSPDGLERCAKDNLDYEVNGEISSGEEIRELDRKLTEFY